MHHILQDMYKTKKKKTRVILRMLPISGTCKAFLEDMKKYAETFLEPWFKAPNKGTFQIVYKSRNNSHMNREEVIKELAGMFLLVILHRRAMVNPCFQDFFKKYLRLIFVCLFRTAPTAYRGS